MSGCRSYYALFRLWSAKCEALCEKLGLTLNRLPSDTTFRRVLQKLDFALLAQEFEQWAKDNVEMELGEWVAIDGKGIKATVTQPQTAYQNFVSLVSFYSSQRGIVLATQQFETKTTSELTVVQTMLEALHLEDVVFTLDALHTQKKLRN